MEQPFIPANKNLSELTPKAIGLAIIMAMILAASNAYIGLKIGWIVSASIPAAMVAMVLFRFAKSSNILEINIVQTGASAAAGIAAGIVFVIPALLIIRYWSDISFWETVFICLSGGILGILFSIPLRKAMLNNPELRFPEGRAIAEVLKASELKSSINDLLWGGLFGAIIQLCQQGLEVMAGTYQYWFRAGSSVFGFGIGFDVTMIGTGYIIGFEVGLSIFIGALIGWVLGIPVFAFLDPHLANTNNISNYVMSVWSDKTRYVGIGAMLTSGIWSLIVCLKPIIASLKLSVQATRESKLRLQHLPRTERDIPILITFLLVGLLLLALAIYLYYQLHSMHLGLGISSNIIYFVSTIIYILIAGFIFSAITAYFSGLVGVSASPVSAVNIAIVITISLLLASLLNIDDLHQAYGVILNAAAISILVTAIIACAAALSNNTIQDLKTGALLGATPWKLQSILVLGVAVSTLVVPPIIALLFNAYGIGGIFPHPHMDETKVLGAPQASLIAAVTQGVFFHNLPFQLMVIGALIAIIVIAMHYYLKRFNFNLSVVALATGIYLPMVVTFPMFIGSLIPFLIDRRLAKQHGKDADMIPQTRSQSAMLIACGLVAGGSIIGVILSIPIAITGSVDVFSIVGSQFAPIATMISIIAILALCYWMYRKGL